MALVENPPVAWLQPWVGRPGGLAWNCSAVPSAADPQWSHDPHWAFVCPSALSHRPLSLKEKKSQGNLKVHSHVFLHSPVKVSLLLLQGVDIRRERSISLHMCAEPLSTCPQAWGPLLGHVLPSSPPSTCEGCWADGRRCGWYGWGLGVVAWWWVGQLCHDREDTWAVPVLCGPWLFPCTYLTTSFNQHLLSAYCIPGDTVGNRRIPALRLLTV